MPPLPALLLLSLTGSGLQIELTGAGPCADAARFERVVERELSGAQVPNATLALAFDAGELSVALRSPEGVHHRTLDVSGSDCAVVAEAVAYLVHSWLSALPKIAVHAEPKRSEPLPAAPAPIVATPPSTPPTPTAPIVDAGPAEAPPVDTLATIDAGVETIEPPVVVASPPLPQVSAAPPLHVSVLVQAGGTLSGPGDPSGFVSGDLTLGFDLLFRPRWHAIFQGGAYSPFSVPLAPGSASIVRAGLIALAAYDLIQTSHFALDLQAGPRLELWDLTGQGFYSDNPSVHFVPGGSLGLRGRLDLGDLLYGFVLVEGELLGPPQVEVADLGSANIPIFWAEAQVGIGIRLR